MSGAPAAAVKLRFGDGAHRFRLDVPISLPELRARAAEAFAAHDRLDHMTAPLSYTDGDGDRIEVISSEDLVLAMEDAAASGRTALTLDVGEAVTALGDHLLATATSALSAPSDDAPIAANNDGLHHTAVITAYHVDSSPGSDLVKPPVDAAEAAEPRAKSSQTRTCSTEVDRQVMWIMIMV